MTTGAVLTVTCSGRDRAGQPTHKRTVVADLALDAVAGVVLPPTAQQRGDSQAGRPRGFSTDDLGRIECLLCGDSVAVGRPPYKELRRKLTLAQGAGVREVPLHLLRS